MHCISPIRIRHPVEDVNGKKSFVFFDVPCGKCMACLKRKRQDWIIRLSEEQKYARTSFFVTLTYDECYIPLAECSEGCYLGSLVKTDFQRFFKRFRKLINLKCKYFAIGEYGSKSYRPHYHFLLFFPNDIVSKTFIESSLTSTWKDGFFKVGTVTPKSISYVTKYSVTRYDSIVEDMVKLGLEKPFLCCSKGLGIGFCDKNADMAMSLKGLYRLNKGFSVLPRYYRDKLGTPSCCPIDSDASLYHDYERLDILQKQFFKRITKTHKL